MKQIEQGESFGTLDTLPIVNGHRLSCFCVGLKRIVNFSLGIGMSQAVYCYC